MKFRACGRYFWSEKNMQQTSGGSWVWARSVTSNRTCPKAGKASRPQPRKCTGILINTTWLDYHFHCKASSVGWLKTPLHTSIVLPDLRHPTPPLAEHLPRIVLVWHGYITMESTLMTAVLSVLSPGNNLPTCVCAGLVSDISQPLPLWTTSATPTCECWSSCLHHILKKQNICTAFHGRGVSQWFALCSHVKEDSLLRNKWWDFSGQIGLVLR